MNIKKLVLAAIIVPAVFLYSQSKDLGQVVHWCPGYDTTGIHWVVYNLYSAELDVLTDTSVGCWTAYNPALDAVGWFANLGNFQGSSPPWDVGDTIVVLGSMDTAYVSDPSGYGDNPNHCGFYWLYSDTIIMETPEYWQPDDTLRVMNQPIAAQVGGPSGNIEISIINPAQTLSGTGTYNVLGYYVWADTTGAGTPNRFDKEVGFFPVSGGAGETTVCIDPVANYQDGQTVYWAYKLVATPDTTAMESRQACPGYSTYYLSQNSNPLVIIGIEESRHQEPENTELQLSPNPFSKSLNINFGTALSTKYRELKIYDVGGQVVRVFPAISLCKLNKSAISVSWDGRDNHGHRVPEGLYFIRLKTLEHAITKKAILVH